MLWLYGLAIDHDSAANFVPVNTAENWLHLGLGIAMLALGLLLGRTGNAPNFPAPLVTHATASKG